MTIYNNIFTKSFIIICLLLSINELYSQIDEKNMQYYGINVAQIPAFAIDLNGDYPVTPHLDISGNIGYGFNHVKSVDLNWLFVPYIKCGNCGIELLNQTGGFIKTGIKLNSRKTYDKKYYLFAGIKLIHSVVYEKADFSDFFYEECNCTAPSNDAIVVDNIYEQTKYIFGIGSSLGFSFKMGNKLRSDLGMQVAFPCNYKSLFGYHNNIPGIGCKDSYTYFFPIIIFNIKYPINIF